MVSDRFLLANVVYQGHAKGLDVNRLWEIGNFITHGVSPDLTFLLDMPPSEAQGRIGWANLIGWNNTAPISASGYGRASWRKRGEIPSTSS